jgi:hypothetical protein
MSSGIMAMTTFPARPEPEFLNPISIIPQDERFAQGIAVLNDVFASIFVAEAVLKIYATRAWYFRERWNQFDFFCVSTTIVEKIWGEAACGPSGCSALRASYDLFDLPRG